MKKIESKQYEFVRKEMTDEEKAESKESVENVEMNKDMIEGDGNVNDHNECEREQCNAIRGNALTGVDNVDADMC